MTTTLRKMSRERKGKARNKKSATRRREEGGIRVERSCLYQIRFETSSGKLEPDNKVDSSRRRGEEVA